jgi:hypothetical protein
MNGIVRHNDNRFALETPALTGGVVQEGHARYCRENGHMFNRKDGVERGWCPRCGEDNGLLPTTAVASDTDETVDLALNVELMITDEDGESATLNVDQAREVLVAAGIPVVGLPHRTDFDGVYYVNTPSAWYQQIEEEGGLTASAAYYTITIDVP